MDPVSRLAAVPSSLTLDVTNEAHSSPDLLVRNARLVVERIEEQDLTLLERLHLGKGLVEGYRADT